MPPDRDTAVARRFFVLVMFSLMGFTNQLLFVMYANIVRETQTFYGCSAFLVNMLAASYSVVYVLFCFPACSFINAFGLRYSLCIGTGLNFLGAVLRLLTALWVPQYWLLAIAQLASATGQLLSMSLPPLVSAVWFPAKERSIATSIGTFCGFLGMAGGFVLPPQIVTVDNHGKESFTILCGIVTGLCLIPFVGTLLGVPNAPPEPPSVTSPTAKYRNKANRQDESNATSYSQSPQSRGEQTTLLQYLSDHAEETGSVTSELTVFQTIWSLRRNTSFIGLVVAVGFVGGITSGLGAVLYQLLEPWSVTARTSGNALCIAIVAGSAACGVVALYLDRSRQYKLPIIILCVLFVLFTIVTAILLLVLPANAQLWNILTYILITLMTASLLPMLPVGFEFAMELTFPHSEVVPATACMWSMSLCAIIATVAAAAVLGNHPTKEISIIIVFVEAGLITLLAIVIGCVVKEDRKRLALEEQEAER